MSRGQQVIAEIKLIRSALAQQAAGEACAGTFRIQKRPRQAVWVIHHSSGKAYYLTYQPAPISAWSLHPPDSNASRLLGVIDRALNSHAATSDRRGT